MVANFSNGRHGFPARHSSAGSGRARGAPGANFHVLYSALQSKLARKNSARYLICKYERGERTTGALRGTTWEDRVARYWIRLQKDFPKQHAFERVMLYIFYHFKQCSLVFSFSLSLPSFEFGGKNSAQRNSRRNQVVKVAHLVHLLIIFNCQLTRAANLVNGTLCSE